MSEQASKLTKRYGWLIVLVFGLSLIGQLTRSYVPNTWLAGDGAFYLNIQKSLSRYSTLDQGRLHPHSWYSQRAEDVDGAFSNISLGTNGEWWPKHSYLMPIVALPFYWLFGVVGTLIFNLVATLAMVLLSYALARKFASEQAAAVATLVVAFAGPFAAYSYNFSNDGFYTVLLLGGLLASLNDKAKISGALLGLAVWAKVTNILFLPIFVAIMLSRTRNWNPWKHFLLCLGIPLSLFALANWIMFGAPWITAYQRVVVVENGLLTTASHVSLFALPFWTGLGELLLSRHHGLLTTYTLFWVGFIGFVPLIRRHKGVGVTLLVVMLSLVVFFAPYEYYDARFLLPWFSLSVIPMAVFAESLLAWVQKLSPGTQLLQRAAAALLLVLVIGRAAYLWPPHAEKRLSNHLENARVFLGNLRCDYFNNMRWSWECTQFKEKESEFVGRNANQEHPFEGGIIHDYVFVPGHQSGAPRRLVFPNVALGSQLTIRYGLDQKSREPHNTALRVHVAGIALFETVLTKSGLLLETELDTTAFVGEQRDVVLTITSPANRGARFLVDGWVSSSL
jgi:4-amino-4-deoxy-L-arabinose transferase-like glycosyltransferase